jgi:hypothetical protein
LEGRDAELLFPSRILPPPSSAPRQAGVKYIDARARFLLFGLTHVCYVRYVRNSRRDFGPTADRKIWTDRFFLFFPCKPLKSHKTAKEILGDSKEFLAGSKEILADSKERLAGSKEILGTKVPNP